MNRIVVRDLVIVVTIMLVLVLVLVIEGTRTSMILLVICRTIITIFRITIRVEAVEVLWAAAVVVVVVHLLMETISILHNPNTISTIVIKILLQIL